MFGIAMAMRSSVSCIILTSTFATYVRTHNVGCLVGDEVTAIRSGSADHHHATIHSINSDDTITVDWDDKATTDRQVPWDGVLKEEEVCSRPVECFVGDHVEAVYVEDSDQERSWAIILSISSDGIMTVKWDDPDADAATTYDVPWNEVEKDHIVCSFPYFPPTPPGPPPPGAIVSTWSGKCLDLPGGDQTNGNGLWIWDCDGSPSQKWAWNDYVIHWDGGLVWTHCLDVPFGDTTNGNGLWIWECLGLPQQQWSYDEATKAIYNGDGGESKCIDLQNGGDGDGTLVQLWDCVGLQNMNQMWELGSSAEALVI